MTLSGTEWAFGLSSLAGFLLALYTHFRHKVHIYALIEKLRSARNELLSIDDRAKRITEIGRSHELSEPEKVGQMKQVAYSIRDGIRFHMNTIDDGKDWGQANVAKIYKLITERKAAA